MVIPKRLALPIVALFAAVGIGMAAPAAPAVADEVTPASSTDVYYGFDFTYWGDTNYTSSSRKMPHLALSTPLATASQARIFIPTAITVVIGTIRP